MVELLELGGVVGAEDGVAAFGGIGADGLAVGEQERDRVGQIIFACGVVGLDFAEHAEQQLTVKPVAAGVDLVDFEGFLIGVLVLDDRLEVAVFVADDSAVARRVVELSGNHRCRATGAGVLFERSLSMVSLS